MFERYGSLIYRFRIWILAIALACMAGAGYYASGVYDSLTQGGFSVPGSQSEMADSIVSSKFGGDRNSLIILFSSPRLQVNDPRYRQAVEAIVAPLAGRPDVSSTASYYLTGDRQFVSRDGHETYALVGLRGDSDQQSAEFEALAPTLHSQTLRIRLGGAAAVNAASTQYVKQDLSRAERYTFPITALLLVVIFGSLAAAALPLAVGVYGVIGALVITRLVAYATDMSVYVLNLISLLGLGLAIDYSLFMVSRYREELAASGGDERRALIRTVSTAGRTVLFSALTVLIALLALTVFPIGFLRSMGIGGSAAVLVAMVGALFFLPAILAMLGPTVNALKISALLPHHIRKRPRGPGVWATICHKVMRVPHLTVALTLAVVVLAGLPFLRIHFTNPDYRILPQGSQPRVVGQLMSHDFGASASDQAPLQIVVKTDGTPTSAQNLQRLMAYVQRLQRLPDVQSVSSLVTLPGVHELAAYQQLYAQPMNPTAQAARQQFVNGSYTLIQLTPTAPPYSLATKQLVQKIQTMPSPGLHHWIGGQTAELVDLLATIRHDGAYALIIMIGAMLVLFFLMLGSIVIPLKTVLLNILSLAAAFGALVWIFQLGHLDSWLGITAEDGIDATQPVIIFALAFGLSMDYAIFLFSRVKEHFDEHADIEKAIAWGVQRTGGIITSAALLLLVVIGAFATGRILVMKEVGIGLIVAVLVDVFIVRLLLVPASMTLLDKYNWWAPRPLRTLHNKLGIKESD